MKKVYYLVVLLIMSAIVSCSVDNSGPYGRNSIIGAWEFEEWQFLFDGEDITVPAVDVTVYKDTVITDMNTSIVERRDTTICPVITWYTEDGVWYSLNVGSVYFDGDGYCYNYDVWQWSYDALDKICVKMLNEDEDKMSLMMSMTDEGLQCDGSVQVLGYYIHNDANIGLHRPALESLYGYDGKSHTLDFNIKLGKMTKK